MYDSKRINGRNSFLKALLVTVAILAVPVKGNAAEPTKYAVQPGVLNVTLYQWPEHSGDVRVDINDEISRPAVGRIPVAGRTLGAIESMLRVELAKQIDLRNAPIVVSVADYRSITVLGAVNNPGRHKYEIGLTVLDAIGLSGGPLALILRENTFDQVVRPVDYYEKEGKTTVNYLSALARRERLNAEKADQEKLEISSQLTSMLKGAGQEDLAERELATFNLRRKGLSDQKKSAAQQIADYKEEMDGLKNHSLEVLAAISKVEEEYKRLQSLLDRRLIRRVDLISVDNQLTSLQNSLRSAIVPHANTRSELVRAESTAAEAAQTRATEIEKELLDLEKVIKTLAFRRAARDSLDPGKALDTSANASENENVIGDGLAFSILRKDIEERTIPVKARANDRVLPGDVPTVTVPRRNF
ncbi:polysaccharide biosynthesis/export family protein [Microvirga sp. KLBC 81]|uniref:polysaccharide biosynthesis/export family protein n=1 Tax=Microvirga sp. KLBC 81 TaxID=1862707 RepID=UPI001403335F|nr:polysaccharide biosynthesis/export family protein [Microvirga sp. KLBC 81]